MTEKKKDSKLCHIEFSNGSFIKVDDSESYEPYCGTEHGVMALEVTDDGKREESGGGSETLPH